jgi:hypothetical protein
MAFIARPVSIFSAAVAIGNLPAAGKEWGGLGIWIKVCNELKTKT